MKIECFCEVPDELTTPVARLKALLFMPKQIIEERSSNPWTSSKASFKQVLGDIKAYKQHVGQFVRIVAIGIKGEPGRPP